MAEKIVPEIAVSTAITGGHFFKRTKDDIDRGEITTSFSNEAATARSHSMFQLQAILYQDGLLSGFQSPLSSVMMPVGISQPKIIIPHREIVNFMVQSLIP